MRKIYYLLFIVLSTAFTACDSSSDSSVKTRKDIYILVDNTEECPSRKGLISTQNLINIMGDGSTITFKSINAVSMNEEVSTKFVVEKDANPLVVRIAEKKLKAEIEIMKDSFLAPVKKQTNSSAIYKTICQTLKELEESPAPEKILIIVSDMIEFSHVGNFYRDQDYEKLKQRLRDSSGITLPEISSDLKVIILYNPKGDAIKEQRFDRAMGYWKKLFSEIDITPEKQTNF